jgi:flagellar protein FliJ
MEIMAYQFKFEKVLNIKEQEKEEAQIYYKDSISKFELVAEKLYDLLKKKENLETFQTNKLISGFHIHEIRHYQQFISNIEKTIEYYQELVIQARNRMNWYEQKLSEMSVEVKKYEKMKEKDFLQFNDSLRISEEKFLDELTVMQFMNRGN